MWRLILTSFFVLAQASAYVLPAHEFWQPHIDADALFFGHRQNGGVTLFGPLVQAGDAILFGQGTVGRFEESWTASLGGGFRIMKSPNFAWGLNLFGDYSHSDSGLNWGQGGVGFEALGCGWEFRANGYIPQMARRTASFNRQVVTQVVGVNVNILETIKQELESARWGFDTEGGAGLTIGPGSLWGYVGYFYFKGRTFNVVQGPRVRLEYKLPIEMSWNTIEFWAGGGYEYTKEYGSDALFTLHLQMPLGCLRSLRCCPKVTVCNRMGDSVRRQNGIFLKRLKQTLVSERTLQLLFVNNTGVAAAGTQTDPTSLNDAVTRANPGDVIFLLNNAANTAIDSGSAPGGQWTLTNNQQALSFNESSSVVVDFGLGATTTVTDLTGFGQARLNQPGGALNGIILGSGNTVSGFIISGGRSGITGTGGTGASISSMTIQPEGGNPAPTDFGIELINMGGTLSLASNTVSGISGATSTGISVFNTATSASVSMTSNSVLRSGAATANGIAIGGVAASTLAISLANNTVDGPNVDGISIIKSGAGGSVSATLSNNTVTGVGATTALTSGAFVLQVAAGSSSTSFAFNMQSNTVTTSPTRAVYANYNGTGNVSYQGLIQGTTMTTIGVAAAGKNAAVVIEGTFAATGNVATVQATSNAVSAVTGIGYVASNVGTDTLNTTITNNTDVATATPATLQAYSIENTGTGTTCLTMTGNNSTGRMAATATDGPIQLNVPTGAMNVTSFGTAGATLSANNNNLAVRVTAGTPTNATTDCPTPSVPATP